MFLGVVCRNKKPLFFPAVSVIVCVAYIYGIYIYRLYERERCSISNYIIDAIKLDQPRTVSHESVPYLLPVIYHGDYNTQGTNRPVPVSTNWIVVYVKLVSKVIVVRC